MEDVEIDSFLKKFKMLRNAGYDASLNFESKLGEVFISLNCKVDLSNVYWTDGNRRYKCQKMYISPAGKSPTRVKKIQKKTTLHFPVFHLSYIDSQHTAHPLS